MQVALSDWHNKTRNLQAALIAAGHTIADRTVVSDVLLMDVDFPVGNYRNVIGFQKKYGAKVFLYSHGANAFLGWDGIWEPQKLDGYFAMAEGTKEIMSRFAKPYPNPVYVIGWHYCDMLPFQPVKDIKKVIFAPWHPHSNGYLTDELKALNARIMANLAEKRGELDITVRHLMGLGENGLDWYEGIDYHQSQPDNSTREIDEADLVISVGTFAQLAIARGKPTIMFGQDVIPHEAYFTEHYLAVQSWKRYKDYMRYPFEFDEITDYSVVTSANVNAWRRLFLVFTGWVKIISDIFARI